MHGFLKSFEFGEEIMQLNYYQYVKKYFPVQHLKSFKESNTTLLVSKQGYVIKQKKFSVNEWEQWKQHFIEEIRIQNILNEQAPHSFLKILDWAEEVSKQVYKIFIIYESTSESQNLEQYLKNNTVNQEKLINIIFQILRIGLELQNRKIFHLNITPKNFIYTNGFIKLTDFGSARVIHTYYFSKNLSEEQKYQFHFYQSTSMLNIEKLKNQQDQDQLFQDIIQNELLQDQIFRKNDEWSISLLISQIISKQFDIKIKNYEDYFCFNSFRVKEMLEQVRKSFPQLYIICYKLLEQQLGLKVAYDMLVDILAQSKTSISKVKPLIMKLNPINCNEENQQTPTFIAKNYYYVPIAEVNLIQEETDHSQSDQKDLQTTFMNDSKKIINDEKKDKMKFLHSVEISSDNQLTTFLIEPSILNMIKDNQLQELQLKDREKYLQSLQNLHRKSKKQDQEKILSQINLIQQSFSNKLQVQDRINNHGSQIRLTDFIQQFWNENFVQNGILKQFYQDILFQSDYGLNYNESQFHLFNYKSDILDITDKNQIYRGYQNKDKIPHGLGIKYFKQKKQQLIFGIFSNGIIEKCIMIEEDNQYQVSIFQGSLNEKQIKQGECIFEWFKLENNKFIQFQKHIGLIQSNKIVGYGERIYYKTIHSKYQFNYIYKGNFENSQKQGQGKLFKEIDGKLELVFDGEFESDQYSGNGIGYFNSNLLIKATFSKGKIVQCQDLRYKGNSVTVF